VLRALEKDPDQRFASAEEMSRSLVASAGPVATDGAAGSLSTIVHPSAPPAADEAFGPGGPRRARRRLPLVVAGVLLVAAAVVVPLVLLGGGNSRPAKLSTSGTTVTTSGGTATTSGASSIAAASAALQPLLGQWKNSVTSGPVNSSQGLIAVIAHDTTSVSSTATVYSFTGGRWNVLSSQDLGFSLMAGTPIVSGSVTGGPDPDFLVQQEGASQAVGSVLSNVNGSWQIVPFRTSTGVENQAQDLHFTDGHPVSQTNTCTPTCAAGNQVAVFFNYDAGTHQFVQQ
jgi:hypothetical protein